MQDSLNNCDRRERDFRLRELSLVRQSSQPLGKSGEVASQSSPMRVSVAVFSYPHLTLRIIMGIILNGAKHAPSDPYRGSP